MEGRQYGPATRPAAHEDEYNALFDSSADRRPPPSDPPDLPDAPDPSDSRRVPRALVVFLLGSVVFIMLACGAVFLTVQQLTGNIPRVPNVFSGLDNANRPSPVVDRVSFLIMGTDSRQAGQRDDTVLTLARVDVDLNPSATRASVVSIPRDAWVDIPDRGPGKISSAYGLGGPTLLVQTVEQAHPQPHRPLRHHRLRRVPAHGRRRGRHRRPGRAPRRARGAVLRQPGHRRPRRVPRPAQPGSRPPSGRCSTRRRRTGCSATRSSSSACSTR